MTFHISLNDTKTEILREYHEGIIFDKPYEVALKSFVTYNNIFNVTEKNNRLVWLYLPTVETDASKSDDLEVVTLEQQRTQERKVRGERAVPSVENAEDPSTTTTILYTDMDDEEEEVDDDEDPKKKKTVRMARQHVVIPVGIYEIADIAEYVESQVPKGKNFKMSLNKKTLLVEMKGNVGVDFSARTSVGPTLGFKRGRYKANVEHVSNTRVDIFPINMIRVRCNLVKSNVYDTRRHDNTIYEFPLNALPGEKIIERPNTATFYKVNTDTIYEVHLRIVDQDNHLIDFRGERVNIVLEFRPAQ